MPDTRPTLSTKTSDSTMVAREVLTSVAKSIFGLVPYAGAALDQICFDLWSRLKQDRINRFVEGVAAEVTRLEKDKVDYGYLHSEEFIDLLEQILLAAARTRQEEKRTILRRLLVNQIQGLRNIEWDHIFLNIVEQLQPLELTILALISNPPMAANPITDLQSDRSQIPFDSISARAPGLSKDQVVAVINDLVRHGLVLDDSLGRFDTSILTYIRLSALGSSFMKWIGAS